MADKGWADQLVAPGPRIDLIPRQHDLACTCTCTPCQTAFLTAGVAHCHDKLNNCKL